MSKLIEQLMTEYDEMRADGYWDGDHPIVQMAEHIDSLVQQRNELAAQVGRLRESFVQLREVYEAEWPDPDAAARNRPEWARVDETPPAALAALKAQWQADAVRDFEAMLSSFPATAEYWIEQRAQEAGDDKTSNQQP